MGIKGDRYIISRLETASLLLIGRRIRYKYIERQHAITDGPGAPLN